MWTVLDTLHWMQNAFFASTARRDEVVWCIGGSQFSHLHAILLAKINFHFVFGSIIINIENGIAVFRLRTHTQLDVVKTFSLFAIYARMDSISCRYVCAAIFGAKCTLLQWSDIQFQLQIVVAQSIYMTDISSVQFPKESERKKRRYHSIMGGLIRLTMMFVWVRTFMVFRTICVNSDLSHSFARS